MAAKVFITNFENIEDAKIVLDGLVALVGESNNGKTATYNALYVLTYNVQGTGYIRKINNKQVPGGCRIGIMFEDINSAVIFEKSASPVYTIKTPNGTLVLDKAGRGGTPQDVADLLNMTPLDVDGLPVNLNFVGQLSEPLLKKLSEYQLYKVAVKSFDGEKIQEAIALCKTDLDAKSTELKKKEDEIEVQKKSRLRIIEQLGTFDPLVALKGHFDEYDVACRVYPTVFGLMEKRDNIVWHIVSVDKTLGVFDQLETVNKAHARAQALELIIVGLESYNAKREQLKNDIKIIEGKLDPYKKLDKLQDSYEKYGKATWELKDVLDLHNSRLNLEEEIRYTDKKLSFLGIDLNDLNSGLTQYKDNKETFAKLKAYKEKRDGTVVVLNSIDLYLGFLSTLPDSSVYVKNVNVVRDVELLHSKRDSLVKQVTTKEEQLKEIDTEVKRLQYMVDNHICEACGQVISEEHGH